MNYLDSYASIDLQSEVYGASPLQLTQKLFNKLIKDLDNVSAKMRKNEFKKDDKHMKNATEILLYLLSDLKPEENPELVERLKEIYMFISKDLLLATIENNADKVDRCCAMVKTIKVGWDGLAEKLAADEPQSMGG